MHKSAIKSFATQARLQLREQIQLRAAEFGLTAKALQAPDQFSADSLILGDKVYGSEEAQGYKSMVARFETLTKQHSKHSQAFEALIDEAAYSWFNRLCALRLMEVQGFLPRRALSNGEDTSPTADPELLKDALRIAIDGELPGIDAELVDALRYNDDAALYRKLLVAQCNALKGEYPFLFAQISEELALLLPLNLLSPESVVRKLVQQIPEADWQEVEIIGWLYQYYISDRKDAVIGAKSKVATEDIPAATQLFTPAWIVQYMVQNSLGRLWLESHPDSTLRSQMPYYLDTPPQSEAVQIKLDAAKAQIGELRPEDIRLIDPACGSGHILVYAFDLLFEIYREQGYRDRDIAPLILEHNLVGLDLDGRAVQLASFALMMKARQSLRRLKGLQPNVVLVQSSKGIELDTATSLNVLSKAEAKPWHELITAFKDADALGSLITPPALDYAALESQLPRIQNSMVQGLGDQLQPLVKQAILLSESYDVVVANPPYMGSKSFNGTLKKFVETHYKRSKSDMFAIFMEQCLKLTQVNGYMAMINQHSWMFLSSYEKLREHLNDHYTVTSMLHLGTRAFPEIGGEVVQSTAFVMKVQQSASEKGVYVRLVDYKISEKKAEALLAGKHRYEAAAEDFAKIPGIPAAYWVSERVKKIFEQGKPLGKVSSPRQGLATANNDRFMRFWHEVFNAHIGFSMESRKAALMSQKTWFPYNKGGEFRKWYGNQEYVVNWFNDGDEIRNFTDDGGKVRSRPQNVDYYFQSGITWTLISTLSTAFRLSSESIFGHKGPCIFDSDKIKLRTLLGFSNSVSSYNILKVLSPTIGFEVGQISLLPILDVKSEPLIATIDQAISLSKTDWDSFETSWDFALHPMARYAHAAHNDLPISESFAQWQQEAEDRFRELQRLEVENNRFWIDAYGLQDELEPDVPDNQVTVSRAELSRDVGALLSYALGCIMGRYSLDQPGLVHAGQPFDASLHQRFAADADAIVPIHDVGWFNDDLVLQVMAWFKTVFGERHYADNLRYLAEVIGLRKGETPEDTLRRYFLQDFMTQHHKTYKKRPIYWFFTSGKQRAFNAYMYLHRYDKDTLGRLRTEYLHPLQLKLQGEFERLQGDTASARRVKQLQDQLKELQAYDEVLKHKADQRIELDLDDGVAYNYTLFEGLVYEGADLKIKDLLKKSQWKRDLLAEAEKNQVESMK